MSDRVREFWMVYGIGQREPRVQYETEEGAAREARRLAEHIAGTFVVLRAVQAFRKVDPVQPIPVLSQEQIDSGLPF